MAPYPAQPQPAGQQDRPHDQQVDAPIRGALASLRQLAGGRAAGRRSGWLGRGRSGWFGGRSGSRLWLLSGLWRGGRLRAGVLVHAEAEAALAVTVVVGRDRIPGDLVDPVAEARVKRAAQRLVVEVG